MRAGAGSVREAALHGVHLHDAASSARIRQLTLFAALSHMTALADPRKGPPSDESLRQLRDAVDLAARADADFAAVLGDWVRDTAQMVADVRSGL